jgi:hypothetical protein
MAFIKQGATVRQIIKPIEGVVKRFAFDPAEGEVSYVIGWSDADGDHEVSLAADQVEEVVEAPAPIHE